MKSQRATDPIPRLLFSTAEAASAIGVSTSTIQRLVREGTIPTILVRSKLRINPAALTAYVRTLERDHTQRIARRRGRPPLALSQRLRRDAQQQTG